MPISLAVFLIAIIAGGGFLLTNSKAKKEEILTVSANPSINMEETKKENSTPSPSPTELKSSTPSPTPTIKNSFSSDEFFYPNSKKVSGDGNSFIIESSDDADVITDWYKEKIRSLGFSTKTFVTTKTNGKVLNKLVGANGEKEIKIEISKEENQSVVRISVDKNF